MDPLVACLVFETLVCCWGVFERDLFLNDREDVLGIWLTGKALLDKLEFLDDAEVFLRLSALLALEFDGSSSAEL